jgi:GNAT superfamily N-acetyltransferase
VDDGSAIAWPAWSLLEVDLQRAFLRHLATSPLARVAPAAAAVQWVVTGVVSNTHNGVAATRLSGADVDSQIEATLRRLSGHPAMWHLSGEDAPADLGARLIRAGCRPERTGVVMGRPCAGAVALPPPAGVQIRELTNAGQVEAWGQVAAGVWADEAEADLRRQSDLYASLPVGPGAPWRHWLAWTEGHPIGMASGMFTADAAMVEHVGVLDAYRGAGVGAALVTTIVGEAAARLIPYAVLAPTPESRSLYVRLGFTLQPVVPDRQFYLP